ncbi:5-methyltetrahydropteroyltriglutamate--homocysteine S-methyltransferase [Amantichitinum ursilacus]|uniref:5-methyltetrahydropteroyltriglutamate--homocysteine methyltransferase n=1 Tax=Amantichitinum ursilacus TaxID=857265 RepID=A0A0N0GQ52_9NEIS|nr:5-methyltetrahydropteroyltriglutamate--homocysteine S-methyltransferase [Amantichitinum ursilacus]KPC54302.1 5-methyltetrahydropteroyltriglutamate--homocysteine methyltransferase [Amantichitinum ursilacus]
MTQAHVLGFPHIGAQRELKQALEQFWRGDIDENALAQTGAQLRRTHWQWQRQAGLDSVAVGDFAWYDQMLNTAVLLGALPRRFGFDAATLTVRQYFELARGNAAQAALEMTKWFDTNYHYLVPELDADSTFAGGVDWLFYEIDEARSQGHCARPVLIGPLTFLYLSKSRAVAFDKLDLLPQVQAAYARILQKLAARGVQWVQIDEPILALDLPPAWLDAFAPVYRDLGSAGVKLLLATYFEDVSEHAGLLAGLNVAGVHLDLVRAPQQLDVFLPQWPADKVLSLGVVDGRNIWANDLAATLVLLRRARQPLGARLWLGSSCSLLHSPVDLAHENQLDAELRSWLAFARQKLDEIAVLKQGLLDGAAAIATPLAASQRAQTAWRNSPRIHQPAVQARVRALRDADSRRNLPYPQRQPLQQAWLQLPPLPTTTIGSFPQTSAIRSARAAFKRGELDAAAYQSAMQAEIERAVRKQEALGLDVLVHGEAERNDMVEYFGEQLAGFAFTRNGWVQSYGSRCVKPPILLGDVSRPQPMTVAWSAYAQSLTVRPMKGMLTGPVTILQWSFVRSDIPRSEITLQIALAIRDEVADLEQAGIRVIQIDEPAFREGLPLKRRDWSRYLEWAGRAFRVSASGVDDATQIHTHMCYSEFNDILPAIAAMDADVITIETSRSDMALLRGFGDFAYPNEIGPGVYDIHSPRVPAVAEMLRLIAKAQAVVPVERLWINPDCGLKTRGWPETEAALRNMLQATREARAALAQGRALNIEATAPAAVPQAACACKHA